MGRRKEKEGRGEPGRGYVINHMSALYCPEMNTVYGTSIILPYNVNS